jgi:methylated-DNA-[protein]-cysteine S-methyltransferase
VRYRVVETALGWIAMAGSDAGLSLLTLPHASPEAALAQVERHFVEAVEDVSAFGDLTRRLRLYARGEKVAFPDRVDLGGATAFQRAVWQSTRWIPYGEVRSYAWVAKCLGRPGASRAVGGALARNRLPIVIPCHRVVGSDGALGGFSGGLGLKKRLLELESAET